MGNATAPAGQHMSGAGAGDSMSRSAWNFTPTHLQIKPHEGLAPEAIRIRNVSQTLVSEDASATPRLAKPPEWMQDELPCAGRWDLFDIESKVSKVTPQVREAKALCADCPVRQRCLEDAMDTERSLTSQYRVTMRGGLTPSERATLSRKWRQAA